MGLDNQGPMTAHNYRQLVDSHSSASFPGNDAKLLFMKECKENASLPRSPSALYRKPVSSRLCTCSDDSWVLPLVSVCLSFRVVMTVIESPSGRETRRWENVLRCSESASSQKFLGFWRRRPAESRHIRLEIAASKQNKYISCKNNVA